MICLNRPQHIEIYYFPKRLYIKWHFWKHSPAQTYSLQKQRPYPLKYPHTLNTHQKCTIHMNTANQPFSSLFTHLAFMASTASHLSYAALLTRKAPLDIQQMISRSISCRQYLAAAARIKLIVTIFITFRPRHIGYYNMSKSRPAHTLNTINILYPNTQQLKPAPSAHKNKTPLKTHHNQYTRHSPEIHYDNNLTDEPAYCDFNDDNLKSENRQALKESTFSRMRIHMYRKEKAQKWLDLLEKRQPQPLSHSNKPPEPNKQQFVRENKTSIQKRKKTLDFIERNAKAKNTTTSSERQDQSKQLTIFQANNLTFRDSMKRKPANTIAISSSQFSPLNKVMVGSSPLSKPRNESSPKIEPLSKRHPQSIENKRGRGPSESAILWNRKKQQKQSFSVETYRKGQEERFEAWQIGDAWPSKIEIVQYTNQETEAAECTREGGLRADHRRQRRVNLRNMK